MLMFLKKKSNMLSFSRSFESIYYRMKSVSVCFGTPMEFYCGFFIGPRVYRGEYSRHKRIRFFEFSKPIKYTFFNSIPRKFRKKFGHPRVQSCELQMRVLQVIWSDLDRNNETHEILLPSRPDGGWFFREKTLAHISPFQRLELVFSELFSNLWWSLQHSPREYGDNWEEVKRSWWYRWLSTDPFAFSRWESCSRLLHSTPKTIC